MKTKFYIAFLLTLTISSLAFGQKIFTLDDLDKITSLSEPSLSPDGQTALVVLSKPDFSTNKRNYSLIAIQVKTKIQRILVTDRPSVGHVRWSPDGKEIAFLALNGQGKDAHFQIFILPFNGGEARKITEMEQGVSQFSWDPEGKQIAFVAQDSLPNKATKEKGFDAFEVGNNSFLMNEAPAPSHIWLISLQGGNPKRLTSGSWSLPVSFPPGPSPSPLSWSPDGKLIAFEKDNSPFSGELVQSIQTLNVTTGEIKSITGRTPDENHGFLNETNPKFSPDGKWISYSYPLNETFGENHIFITPSSGGKGKPITREIDHNLFLSIWSPDSKSILVGGNDVDKVSIWMQGLNQKAIKIHTGNLSLTNFFNVQAMMNKNGSTVFIASSPTTAPELYFLDKPLGKPLKLTEINKEVSQMNLGKSEFLTWKNDQFTCNGILTYPPDFDPSKKYPLVLIIHGGPQYASLMNFNVQAQFTASRGYLVFEPNYRGSDNLGDAFDIAINKDAGEGPGRDVMAGLSLIKQRSFVDTNRIGVSGWSYGGYMTTWLIGHYPKVWKCAVAGASVTELVSQYSFSDGGVGYKFSQGRISPYSSDSAMAGWMKQSPINNVRFVKAPTLLLHDLGDERVPITETYTFYRGLKDNGVTTKFIVFPVVGHYPGDPVRGKEVEKYWTEWLDKYLKNVTKNTSLN